MKSYLIGAAALASSLAANAVLAEEVTELEEIHVTASADGDVPAGAVNLLNEEELQRARSATLGETLGQQPGIQNAGFGPAVGRPVIRGLGGSRLRILQDGMEAVDASGSSPDHAVAAETDHAHQIEVLRGPATLTYGGGAIGGVVNVVGMNHADVEDETKLRLGYDTVNSGRFFAVDTNKRNGDWGWNLGASERRTDAYDVPSDAGEVHIEEDGEIERHEAESDTQDNSDIEYQRQLTAGVRYFGEQTETAFSVGYLASKFGLPGHDHSDEHGEHHDEEHHDEEHEEHDEEHEGEEHDEHEHEEHEEHEEGDARVDMESIRLAFEHVHANPFAGAQEWKTSLSWTDYEHTEGHEEGEHEEHEHEEEHDEEEHDEEHEEGEEHDEHEHDEHGHGMTTFSKEVLSLRSELRFEPVSGVVNLVGVDAKQQNYSAMGVEALTPSTDTLATGLFWLGEKEMEQLTLSAGARWDYVNHDPKEFAEIEDVCGFDANDVDSTSFSDFSAAVGAVYAVSDSLALSGSVTSASRAPESEELYSCGAHESTLSYEVGDPDLVSERALNMEVGLKFDSDKWLTSVSVYRNNISDFIYAHAQLEGDEIQEEDGLPVYAFIQNDVNLTGAELELAYQINEQWAVATLADTVRGELDEGGYLERMPADRAGLKLNYESASWSAYALWMEYFEQDRVAKEGDVLLETPTEGFSLLNLGVGYHWYGSSSEYHVNLKGTNLLDEVVRYHTSFVKDLVPQPGRGFKLEVSAVF